MSKRFVLSGYFGFKNFGDEAILSVLVKKLQEHRARITVITSNPDYTKSQFEHIRCVKTFDFERIIGAISKSDFLISGGGSLLQDVTSLKSLIYYLLIIFIALLFRKKVIIFAQGIGPINNPLGQILTKNILRHASYISVRDKKSHELLSGWGIKSDLLCDPIFSLQIPPVQKNKTLAIQLRNCKGMNNDFLDRLSDKVCTNFKGYNIEIYSFQDSIDLDICRRFEKNINMLNSNLSVNVCCGLSNNEIIEKISTSEYLISMRFHAAIIGILSGVKTLCINYDPKVEKLAKEYNLPMINLKTDFNKQFEVLKAQDADAVGERVRKSHFDWNGFERAIN